MIAEGHDLVRACLRRNQPGAYQLQAAIAAVHTDADATADRTEWPQIVALYDQLVALHADAGGAAQPGHRRWPRSPGPAAALDLVEALDLDGYHLFHATRADLLRRLRARRRGRRRLRNGGFARTTEIERSFLTRQARLLALL